MKTDNTMIINILGKEIPIDKKLYMSAMERLKIYDNDDFENDIAMYFNPPRGTNLHDVIIAHSIEELSKAAEDALKHRLKLLNG